MDELDKIEAHLRSLPEGIDPIKAAASEIQRERRAHAATQGQLALCSVTVGKQNEQLVQQNRDISQQSTTINKLNAELAELRTKNPA